MDWVGCRYEVMRAGTSEEAMELVAGNSKVDLVVLDSGEKGESLPLFQKMLEVRPATLDRYKSGFVSTCVVCEQLTGRLT